MSCAQVVPSTQQSSQKHPCVWEAEARLRLAVAASLRAAIAFDLSGSDDERMECEEKWRAAERVELEARAQFDTARRIQADAKAASSATLSHGPETLAECRHGVISLNQSHRPSQKRPQVDLQFCVC